MTAVISLSGGVGSWLAARRWIAMAETQKQCDGLFDLISFCRHHPRADHPEMARCWCRKPSAGAIAVTAQGLRNRVDSESYPASMGLMVVDRDEDEECARSAGLGFQWAHNWRTE